MFIQVSIFREDAAISFYRTVSRQVCFRIIFRISKNVYATSYMKKLSSGLATKQDFNQPAQLQRLAGTVKFLLAAS